MGLRGVFGICMACSEPYVAILFCMLVPLKPRPSVISSTSGDIVGFRQKPLMSVLTRDIFRPVPRGFVPCCLSPNACAVYCLKYKNRPFLCERTSTGVIAPKPRMPQFSVPSEKGIRIASRHPLLSIVAFSFDDPRNERRHPQSEKIDFFPLPLPPEGTPSSPVFRNARVPLAALCGRCPSGSPAAPGIMSTIDTSATTAHILTTFFFFASWWTSERVQAQRCCHQSEGGGACGYPCPCLVPPLHCELFTGGKVKVHLSG